MTRLPYHPRPVTSYGLETLNGWQTKVYGLAVEGAPSADLVQAARLIAAEVLPASPADGAAFVIAHQARPACFVLVYWWATPVDLCLRYFRAPLDQPTKLDPLPENSAGCVWELAVMDHERRAWVRHMLTGDTADLAAYLDAAPAAEV